MRKLSIKCLKCETPLRPETEKCPKCGSRDRHITVADSARALEMIGVKQRAKGYHRFKTYQKQGEKISKSGKLARETLIIDKETKRKRHLVEEQDEKGEWVVVHDEDEPL